jgi:rubrerythrin
MRNFFKEMMSCVLIGIFVLQSVVIAESQTLDQLNQLLRHELAVVQTYREAIRRVANRPESKDLYRALADHELAVAELKTEIGKLGGTPEHEPSFSPQWPLVVAAAATSASGRVDSMPLAILEKEETAAQSQYRSLMERSIVSEDFRSLVEKRIMPTEETHLSLLRKMLDEGVKQPTLVS